MEEQNKPKINGIWKKIQGKNSDISLIWRLRKNHSAIHYKHSIIFYGGEPMTPPNLLSQNQSEILNESEQQMNQEINFHNFIHKFDYINKEWTKSSLNLASFSTGPNNTNILSIQFLAQHSAVIVNNFIYFFGGINYRTKSFRPPEMWTINADSLILKKNQAKGSIPCARSGATLLSLNKNSLILFGGYNGHQFLNDIYLYRFDVKSWACFQETNQLSIPKLINPCMAVLAQNNFYIYGGYRQICYDTQTQKVPNYDFYKFKVIHKTISSKPDVEIKKIIHNLPAIEAYSGHLLNYLDKYLILLNNNFTKGRLKSLWFFKPEDVLWTEVKQSQPEAQQLIKSSANFMTVSECLFACNENIFNLTLDQSCLTKDIKETLSVTNIENCAMCESQNYHFIAPKKLLKNQLCSYLQPLSFAYSAIGLLVDNCKLANATICNIYFANTTSTPSQKYILIEDNGQVSNIWGIQINDFNKNMEFLYSGCLDSTFCENDYEEQVKDALKDLQKKQKKQEKQYQQFLKQQKNLQNLPNPNSSNQKSEKQYEKDHLQLVDKRKNLEYKKKMLKTKADQQIYASNWKLGSLRLGDIAIYASKDKIKDQTSGQINDIKRYGFIFLERQNPSDQAQIEDHNPNHRQYYVCYSYAIKNKTCLDPSMQPQMKFLLKKFKKELKIVEEKLKYMNSVVYIGKLRKHKRQPTKEDKPGEVNYIGEFYFRKKINDIYLGSADVVNQFSSNHNVNINDFCDISLRTYLSLLYTKNQNMLINLSIKDNPLDNIQAQTFLPTIDKLAKSRKIASIDQCLDFECKIVEVYYTGQIFESDNIKSEYSFINNGILIYKDGRLITRFKINFGDMIDDNDSFINRPKLFGYIEVNDNFIVNTFKTNFLYATALQPFFSRLNFVYQYFRKKKSPWKTTRDRKEQSLSKPYKKVKID